MVSRRQLLAGIGGVAALGVAGGTVFATTRTPSAALEPWTAPGALATDARVRALEWAVLAPNPHNRQPWLVELVGKDEALLYCDLDRRLPMTDPFDRQITIGLGCFVELFRLAALADGRSLTLTAFPQGEPAPDARLDARPVAHLHLRPGGEPDPLFAAAPHRRSTKEPFGPEPVGQDQLDAVLSATRQVRSAGTLEEAQIAALRDLSKRAWNIEAATPRTHKESVDLMRIGKGEINANPDGIDLGGAFLETLSLVGMLTRETLLDPDSEASRTGHAMYMEMIDTAAGFLWLATDGNSRAEQLAAGRDWLRVNLAATAAGLAIQPLSQALQEFPEMAGPLDEVHQMLGEAGRIQMLARVGHGPEVPPSPRWPARSRLV